MSDPMTHREIEDVLSSIRRLVSQDGSRAAGRTAGGETATGETGNAAGRLVLTEAHRVSTPVAGEIRAGEIRAGEIAQQARASLEATIAELEAAVSATPGEWEAEAGETVDPIPLPNRPANVTPITPRVTLAKVQPQPEPAPESVPDPSNAAPDLPDADVMVPPASVAQTGDAVSDFAQDMPGGDDVLAPTEDDQDAASVFDDTDVIDEATLRAMVAQIVREELHGQLGERITRSVRKLVRAEIARALDANRYL